MIIIILSIFGNLYSYSIDNDSLNFKINSIINESNLKKHVDFLGSDLLRGRGTGDIGIELAAKYLANEFNELGLVPMGINNTYYQPIPIHGSTIRNESELILNSGISNSILIYTEDYLIYNTGGESYIPTAVNMVFAGYGIIAPEFDYNDYQNLDVEGKIVVLLEGEPPSLDLDYFDGYKQSIYGFAESKQRIAASLGAKACIFIPNPYNIDYNDWEELVYENTFEKFSLAYHPSEILSIVINPLKADLLFGKTDFSLNKILSLHKENRLTVFDLNSSISFKSSYRTRDFISSNIIGMIKGKNINFNDSYLIISAHYDHLGIGKPIAGDSIYNGVLDNAIGVSALLCIARSFVEATDLPDRSIIFILTTGEEAGLMGSRYYVDHPVVPLHKTIANVNIDGVSYLDEVNNMIGIGSKLSTLDDIFLKVLKDNNLNQAEIPEQFAKYEAFTKSDQLSFAKAGIPALMIYEGTDYRNISVEDGMSGLINYSENIYHKPFDDLSQDINYSASVQHIRFIFSFCSELLNSPNVPEWKPGVPYINARLRSIAEEK